MKTFLTATAISALMVGSALACPNGQQAYYTQGVDPITSAPIAVENCRKVADHGGDVAWTGNLDKHLTPVLVDADSDPATPDVPLVIDGKAIVTASGTGGPSSWKNRQHTNPVVKGINGVAVGDGAMVGEYVPASDGGTPGDPSDDVPGHYKFVDNGTAVGAGAKVTHQGSTAIGAGAKSTDSDQVTLGTAKDTIKAEGINSQKSKDRQTGPIEVVTSDANGNLATDGGAIFNQLGQYGNTLDAHTSMLSQHSKRLDTLDKGLAIAMAMPDAWLSDKKRFGIFGAVGGFGDETALGFAAIGRIDETWTLNAKAGSDTEFKEFGWQVGVGAQW